MTGDEIYGLVSAKTSELFTNNIGNVMRNHADELAAAQDESGKLDPGAVISILFTTYLRTVIELSTMNTLNVLQSLGVMPPDDDLNISQ